MQISTGQITGKSSQITNLVLFGLYDQYTEHLALTQFFLPVVLCRDVSLYLFGCHDAQRMGSIMKRISELSGQSDVNNRSGKMMQHIFSNYLKQDCL